MNLPDLELRAVTCRVDGRTILDRTSLAVGAGEICALLGASGAGKSTLLRAVAGLEPIEQGAILIAGEELSAPGRTIAPEARRVGLVFQDFALFPNMSAADNVAFGLSRLAKAQRLPAASAWLRRVGLAGRDAEKPHAFSGGEQQRLALARALAPEPRIVLLDEPFSGLDPHLRGELRADMIAALKAQGVAALLVTHDADEALETADTLAVMEGGRIIQAGRAADVAAAPATLSSAFALGAVNLWRGMASGGALRTPFGVLPARFEGPAATAAFADALQPDAGGSEARVARRRPQTRGDLLILEAEGLLWRAIWPRGTGPEENGIVRVRLDPGRAFVFSA